MELLFIFITTWNLCFRGCKLYGTSIQRFEFIAKVAFSITLFVQWLHTNIWHALHIVVQICLPFFYPFLYLKYLAFLIDLHHWAWTRIREFIFGYFDGLQKCRCTIWNILIQSHVLWLITQWVIIPFKKWFSGYFVQWWKYHWKANKTDHSCVIWWTTFDEVCYFMHNVETHKVRRLVFDNYQ